MQKDPYHSFSRGDLERWAGKTILARGEGYRSRVKDLAITGSGQLVAEVTGEDFYLTQVWLVDGGLRHRCTCPSEGPCKHAVAVVLVYLEQVRSGIPVPEVTPDELEATAAVYELVDMPDEEWGSFIDPDKARAALERMPTEEIIEWAVDAITDHPELWDYLPNGLRPVDLAFDDYEIPDFSEKTIARIRQEIHMVTQEPVDLEADYDYVDGDDVPDYSDIKQQFSKLLAAGHTEALIDLGEELFTLGNRQIGVWGDSGSIDWQITGCLDLMFEAVRRSDGSAPERLIRYWDMTLEDRFGLLEDITPPVDKAEMTRADWLRVAKEYKGHLDQPPDREGKDNVDHLRTYRRKRVLDHAFEAFFRAGENGSATELMVSELPDCGNHVELIGHFLERGDFDLVRNWVLEGIQQPFGTFHHMVRHWIEDWMEAATREKGWSQVAALTVELFFMNPDVVHYRQVRKACRKSGHWEPVRSFLLHYLETGHCVRSEAGWPLPKPFVRYPEPGYRQFPDWDNLISVALDEQRLDDAVRIYRQVPSDEYPVCVFLLAVAVKETHPDVTLEIWKDRIESLFDIVEPEVSREAMRLLTDMQSFLEEAGREGEFRAYVKELRERYRAKRHLMEELDFLERKPRKIQEG